MHVKRFNGGGQKEKFLTSALLCERNSESDGINIADFFFFFIVSSFNLLCDCDSSANTIVLH